MAKEEQEDSYSHILKYTGVFGGVQGLGILVGVVRNKLVAMILGPNGMGLISLFNSTIKLVSDSTGLGIPMSAVKDISEAYEQNDMSRVSHIVKVVRSWSLLTALFGAFLCIVLSPLLNSWTFTWGNHTLHFILLSPVVFMTAVTGGEAAILKGARQLKHLAALSVYSVLAALLISVPLYYVWWEAAIVPSLVLIALAQMLITVAYSYHLFPLHVSFRHQLMEEGASMVKLGIAFLLAGILGSGADFVIRSYLSHRGGLDVLGLYNAGYMMTMTYAGMVFSAMETDYFPRLSGIVSPGPDLNRTVNRQIEVSLLLVAPLLVLFMVGLPLLLPLLYSGKFLPVVDMMKMSVPAMYFRAITLPVEFVPLSRGDSGSYLFLEAVYDLLVVVLVLLGYRGFGLVGTGEALLLTSILNLIVVLSYTRYRYGFSTSRDVRLYALVQITLGGVTLLEVWCLDGLFYWLSGILLFLVSLGFSVMILHRKTHLWASLVNRLKRRLHHE